MEISRFFDVLPKTAAFSLFFASFLAVFCCKNGGGGNSIVPNIVEQTLGAADPILHFLPSERTGITIQNTNKETCEENIATNLHKYNGGGIGVSDLNNDDLQEICFVSCDDKCKRLHQQRQPEIRGRHR